MPEVLATWYWSKLSFPKKKQKTPQQHIMKGRNVPMLQPSWMNLHGPVFINMTMAVVEPTSEVA
jgi:hypothetical protein